jgi:stage II sporulation protein AA (anti-sigma F factor antagonist)
MLTVERRGQTLIARLAGELDLRVADDLRAGLDRALDDTGAINLVFNLEKVSFMDSSCLGVILGRYKRVCGNKGTMTFVAVAPGIRRVLEFSGLFRIGKEFPTEEIALADIG